MPHSSALGLFGGTFDPPHVGHLILASVLADALHLDQVLFVLAADPPHKRDRVLTPLEHRLTMLELAVQGDPRFTISRLDIDRPGPHYSVDMVVLAQRRYPDAEMYFLMGGDSLRDLPTWHQPERLLHLCTLAVLHRPGVVVDWSALPVGAAETVRLVEGPEVAVSSSLLVQLVREGRSLRYLVPQAVEDYIKTHELYA